MNGFLALVRKDLRLYFSNRRAVLMSIVAPIVIAAFFGFVFGGNAGRNAKIAIAVTDLDGSPLTQQIVGAMKADGTLDIAELPEADALAAVKAGKRTAAVVLPAGFGKQAAGALFDARQRPQVALHYDPSQAAALQVVKGLLAQHTMGNVGSALLGGGEGSVLGTLRGQVEANGTLDGERRRELLEMFDSVDRVQARSAPSPDAGAAASANGRGLRLELPYTLVEHDASARAAVKYNAFAHAFAGMGVQFILMAGIDLGIGLLTMRRLGLWKRLRAAPLSKSLLLGSRIASTALTALLLLAVIYAAAIGVFGVRIEGSVLGLVGVALAFALLTASFGLLVASLGRTPEATRGLAIFATLLLVMLGGAWVPAFVFPQWLQTVSLFVPTRWAVDGLDAMTWRGLGFEAALAPIGVMLVFTAAFSAVALAKFDWEE